MQEKQIFEKYPLHYHVWLNDYLALEELLVQKKHDIEGLDCHQRSPLLLSVILDHLESARVLLRHGANACAQSPDFWSVSQEATCTGDPELLKLILTHRDSTMLKNQAKLVTSLLSKLKETPDFYVEIKWEFTSWLPLFSRMCPSDVCRVWKQGPNVRIDASLIGFSGTSSWVRGNLSYVFKVTETGVTIDEVNHTDRIIYRHSIGSLVSSSPEHSGPCGAGATVNSMLISPSDELVAKKLTQPVFVTYLDTDKIEFIKSKSGLWGWRSDRKETVNGHDCQVCSASNVQIRTLHRTEHLTEENLRQVKESRGAPDAQSSGVLPTGSSNPLASLLKSSNIEHTKTIPITNETDGYNPSNISMEDYFSPTLKAKGIDIGRPKVMTAKLKTYKAHLYLCEDYPLSLKDQVLPIVDLMSEYNPYFYKLKDFLTKQLPPGFPMKVEIPLYHILNACVTFGNLYGEDAPAYGVVCLRPDTKPPSSDIPDQLETSEESLLTTPHKLSTDKTLKSEPSSCIIDDCVFDIGRGYKLIEENSPGHFGTIDEEEQMVQMAVQRSMMEHGGADQLTQRQYSLSKRGIVETRSGEYVDPEEAMLQEAIADSYYVESGLHTMEEAYMKALDLSREEMEEDDKVHQREKEELERVLQLSLVEK